MAVYTPGRRRAILLLVLTSLLLITIDLRGNALLDAARDGFDRAMRPIEDAAEVVGRPVRNAWRGITRYDDLEAENERLEAQIDAMRTNDIAARSVIEQWQRLFAMFDLESPGDFDRVVAQLLAGSRTAQVAAKRLLREVALPGAEAALRRETLSVRACAAGPDGREGVGAFLAKRPPEFPSARG